MNHSKTILIFGAALSVGFLGSHELFGSHEARAYDSLCRVPGSPEATSAGALDLGTDDCPEGPGAAQGRWRVGSGEASLDEHRQILERSMRMAGIPAESLSTINLRIFSADSTVTSVHNTVFADDTLPSVNPVAFDAADAAHSRHYIVDEMAQLPDFSYSLWDWSQGNETCPLGGGIDPILCHGFKTHMGAANSNHFVPQADNFYNRLHAMAIARAGECRAMHQAIGGEDARFAGYIKQCEYEALTIEAEAQHFLQDAWSSGHMWQRWGSTDINAFPTASYPTGLPTFEVQRRIAVAVAAVSGLIHGAQALMGGCDRMCCPDNNTRFVQNGVVVAGMAGDLHLNDLVLGDSRFAAQRDRLFSCTTASVRQVYDALGGGGVTPMLGALGGVSPTDGIHINASIDPTGNQCHGALATNKAMFDAMAIDAVGRFGHEVTVNVTLEGAILSGFLSSVVSDLPGETPKFLPGWLRPGVSTVSHAGLPAQLNSDLTWIYRAARLNVLVDPNGDDTARMQDAFGFEMTLLGTHANSFYASATATAPYQDPDLPWTGASGPEAVSIARAYNQGHADSWCASMGEAELEALRTRALDTSDSAHQAVHKEICAAFAVRHLRIGTGPTDYDTSKEPLCNYLGGGGFAYEPASSGSTPEAIATAWCGHPPVTPPDPCADLTACDTCNMTGGCGWCEGQGCMSQTNSSSCSGTFNSSPSACVDCTGYTDCNACASDGFCGWCPGMGCLNDAAGGAATCGAGWQLNPWDCTP